ncbi:lysine N(6)-hydroxylase/L-ornithine N(5)-oxygenase family protein [Nocardioides solisilvae]|uniref:lysine N(6)-hydroxylase/L-ornithine N(5)-oxygenase family protein n=1 Tax=Nocardioides solisilvae TaxID=1542435 RepID=UPI000D74A038|nr:SidA/IucD/PvdA family monooxygenase [Nocardioides solisilvae]
MSDAHVHDFVGIGIGPFNLGLAALADPVEGLDGVFLDGRDRFEWHGGMMLDDATLQVPFLADLVTLADPTSRFSFLQFLKETGRLYPFYVRESFYPLRREYDRYCRWVADRLPTLRWGREVTEVAHDGEAYVVRAATGETFRGRRLVLGTGTAPRVPAGLETVLGERGTHSADYLARKAELQATGSITVVGSGQSAAEVYADLLAEQPAGGYALHWVTRSPRFFPMEYTKLTLEMTSPEWSAHFRGLPPETRTRVQAGQAALSKGISSATIDAIHDALYSRSVDGAPDTTLLTATEVTGAAREGDGWRLALRHTETGEAFSLATGSVVLATGYAAQVPAFLDPVRHRIRWDEQGRFLADERFALDDDGTVFVQNGEEHTHGFVAPDLGMGAMRSSVIIAALTGREVYPVEKRTAFQEFGVPDRLKGGVR